MSPYFLTHGWNDLSKNNMETQWKNDTSGACFEWHSDFGQNPFSNWNLFPPLLMSGKGGYTHGQDRKWPSKRVMSNRNGIAHGPFPQMEQVILVIAPRKKCLSLLSY